MAPVDLGSAFSVRSRLIYMEYQIVSIIFNVVILTLIYIRGDAETSPARSASAHLIATPKNESV